MEKENKIKKKSEKKCDIWHVTRNMWHMTYDTWHVTCNTWHMTSGVMWTLSQKVSSLALTALEWRCSEDLKEKDDTIVS